MQVRSSELVFPDGFIWGGATSAYQIEGGSPEDGRTDSIWDTFARVPGAVINNENGDVACDHYHRYPEDVALMKSLNLGSYRFSTAWPRVRPGGGAVNAKGIDFYSRLVDELLAKEIMPWPTMYHWDLPQELEDKGGWTNRDTAYRFLEYALSVHEALSDRVDHWGTINEPWCTAFVGYMAGAHAPGKMSPEMGIQAAHHLLLGHGLVTKAFKEAQPAANLGLTLDFTIADPVDPNNPADVDAARRRYNDRSRYFADPIFKGAYTEDMLEDLKHSGLLPVLTEVIKEGDLEIISTPIDTLGINYYRGEAVSTTPQQGALDGAAPTTRATKSPLITSTDVYSYSRGLPLTALGWEIQPEGLTRLLLKLQEDYITGTNTSLFVTENGCAFEETPDESGFVDDQERLSFYRDHLEAVHNAISEGAKVGGYFAWSLMDNYEWAWGYEKRFGIVSVDFDTQVRTVKASGTWYAEVAGNNSLVLPDS